MNCNDLNGVVALRQHPLSNVEITAQRKTQLCYAQHVTTHPSWSLSAFVWQPGLQGFHQGGCMRLIALVLPRTKWPENIDESGAVELTDCAADERSLGHLKA